MVAAGASIVTGNQATSLQLTSSASGASLTSSGSTSPLSATGGTIGGALTVLNQLLPSYTTQLNDLAGGLAKAVDEVQATGISQAGHPPSWRGSGR